MSRVGGVRPVGLLNSDGESYIPARVDHEHGHGQQTSPDMHAASSVDAAGFLGHTQYQRLYSMSPPFPIPPVRKLAEGQTTHRGGRLVRQWMPAGYNAEFTHMGYPAVMYPGGTAISRDQNRSPTATNPTPYLYMSRGFYSPDTHIFPYDRANNRGGFTWATRVHLTLFKKAYEDITLVQIGLVDWTDQQDVFEGDPYKIQVPRRADGAGGCLGFFAYIQNDLCYANFYSDGDYVPGGPARQVWTQEVVTGFPMLQGFWWPTIDFMFKDPLHWNSVDRNPGLAWRFWPDENWHFVEIDRAAFAGAASSFRPVHRAYTTAPSYPLFGQGPVLLETNNGDDLY